VAGRFPLLTDIHVHDALVEALRRKGWDVLRAVDLLPSNADDEVLFAYAAEHGRVLVTNDRPLEAIAIRWMREGRGFHGLVCWPQKHYRVMTDRGQAQRLRLPDRVRQGKSVQGLTHGAAGMSRALLRIEQRRRLRTV